MNILKNKWFILGNILLLLAVIPITLFVIKRQTDLRSKAAPSTTLSFTPESVDAVVGENLTLDINVNPGQNIVSIVEMTVSLDPEKLEIVSLENNPEVFPVKLKGPTINDDGTVTISMSTSNDVTKAVQTTAKAATLTLKALTETTSGPALVKINQTSSQVFSLATADGETENVLATVGTASVNISASADGGGNPPSATPSGSLTQKPSCTALNIDKGTTGVAPYTIVFTTTGNSTNSTISKVTFNFGDATTQEATSSGGIGTNAVNLSIAHTYNNPGVYSASASLTDALGATSDTVICTKSITVTAAVPAQPTLTPVANNNSNPTPTLPVTGTFENALAIAAGAVVIIGIGLFFFVL
jgi:LPXTG-motif cell wall-anchored protein